MIENPSPSDTLVGRVSAAVADSVTLSFEVTNPTTAPVVLTFNDAQRFDMAVIAAAQKVWQWSADRMFAQMVGTQTWAPGETVTFIASWRPTTKGRITVEAWLARTTEHAGASALFDVP